MKTVITNEQIDERIAKLCGWTEINENEFWIDPKFKTFQKRPPCYHSSLDACREFELFAEYAELCAYCDELIDILNVDLYHPIVASARSRCEAFLRIKGQWD